MTIERDEMTPSDFDLAKIADIRQRLGQLNAWIDTIRGRNGWASFRPEDKPASVPDVSNDERGLLEKFDWVNDPPDRYFAYIQGRSITTWNGEILGSVMFGREYRDNFGGRRIPVRVIACNGHEYFGTYYTSAGDYCRLKKRKGAAR